MAKRTILYLAFTLSFVVTNCKYVNDVANLNTKYGNIEELEGTKPDGCIPKATYVKWSEVRAYLNEYFKLHIPLSYTGVDLKVMRCRHFLAPCEDGYTYCGVEKEKKTMAKIPLKHLDTITGTVVITFFEDEHCKCVTKNWYDLTADDDVSAAPVILEAFKENI